MKLSIKIDSEEEPPSPFSAQAIGKLEGVFGEELPLLRRTGKEIENYPEAELSLSFLNRADMRNVNKEYRGVDEPTDVLSFPLWEEDGSFAPLVPFNMLPLGDIVICPEEAEREHAPMSRPEALCLVLAHGFLHLLGWDHDTPEKEESMWECQERLKAKLMKAVPEGSALTGEVL